MRAKPDGEVADHAEPEDGEVGHHHVGRVLGTGEPGLHQGESGLHENDQRTAQHQPEQVEPDLVVEHPVDQLLALTERERRLRGSGRITGRQRHSLQQQDTNDGHAADQGDLPPPHHVPPLMEGMSMAVACFRSVSVCLRYDSLSSGPGPGPAGPSGGEGTTPSVP